MDVAPTLAQALTGAEIWQITGVVFLLTVAVQVALYVTLYRRPRVDEALVRTGLWDVRVAVNSGLLVLPFVHKIKRVSLAGHSLTIPFEGPHALRWQGGERFEGTLIASVHVPADNVNSIIQAARAVRATDDTEAVADVVLGAYRSTCRDVLRTIKRITFDLEPAAVEVRIAQALDIVSSAFGLRLRGVHLYDHVDQTGRMKRALIQLEEESNSGDGAAANGDGTPSPTAVERDFDK